MCRRCPAKTAYSASAWYYHIDRLYLLQRGGFPFGRNELSLEEWQDLGTYGALLADERETMKMRLQMQLLGGRR